ncbi:MAG TPA: sigma-70 family RNA polymerase sigma factor [Gemmataceae bacterium]|jgi:RNA polymerase sigma factor (sigma-70 family)
MRHRDTLLHHLRRVALHALGEQRTDGQLLEHFISRRDETAFEALLRRHGPMVRGVCRRILGDVHDADDAFQATFLVLVRKAASVRPREAVGNFLYGVAYRTALEARRRMARRRAREMPLPNVSQPESESSDRWQELCPLLDREINRLSEKYRLPVVLCELEGRSRKEVARQLAIPEGTLSSRLATARKKLAVRLARYGFAFSGASLAALLAENTASACVPPALSGAAIKAAMLMAVGPAALGVVSTTVTTLTEGVLKAMFIAKIKTATVVLCGVAALGVGTGGVVYQTRVGAANPQKVERGVQGQPRRATEVERETEVQKQQEDVAQLREMLRKEQERNNKLVRENADLKNKATVANMERQSVQDQSNRLEAQLQQKDKWRQIAEEAPANMRTDWKIVRMDRRGTNPYINLGSADKVKPQLTFTIHGVGLDGRPNPRPKGTLEVVNVIANHLSQARVTSVKDANRDPILVGDILYNPNLRPDLAPRLGDEKPPEKDKWRRIAEEAQAREKELRAELENARYQMQILKAQIELLQGRAEVERPKRAEAAPEAKKDQSPQPAAIKPADRKADPDAALDKLERERAALIAQHKKHVDDQRLRLEAEQKRLEDELRKKLAQLDDLKAQIIQEQAANRPNPGAGQKPAGGDKLDQILERLERLEKRLDRLEKGRR